MAVRYEKHRCYVCRKFYGAAELGRVRLPLVYRTGMQPWHRVVCNACYEAIYDSWPTTTDVRPPAFHGF